jgi:MFS family permease
VSDKRITDLRPVLNRVLAAWLFGASWLALTSGATLTRFARQIGLTEMGFGVLAAIPFLAAFVQLPATWFVERYGHRKAVFLTVNLAHRFIWLLIALIPWVLPAGWRGAALVGLMFLASALNEASGPSWYGWLSDLVPARIRGRYTSRRSQAGQLVGLTLTVLAGLALDWADRGGVAVLLRTLSVLLAGGAVLGMVDIAFFFSVPDPGGHAHRPETRMRDLVGSALRDRSFRHYLGFIAAIVFGTSYVGQFSWLYAYDVLKLSNTQANLMLTALPQVVGMLGMLFWGRMIDRLGRKPVAMLAGLCVVPGAAFWILVRPGALFPGYVGILAIAFAWPGVDLASYNILLGLVDRRRAGRSNLAYVAVASVVSATAGTLSGLGAGALARSLRDWHGSLLGLPLTYHAILFLIAGVFRLTALWFLRGVEDRRAFSARAAAATMAASLYSNVQAVFVVPARAALRWTYKLAHLRPGRRR